MLLGIFHTCLYNVRDKIAKLFILYRRRRWHSRLPSNLSQGVQRKREREPLTFQDYSCSLVLLQTSNPAEMNVSAALRISKPCTNTLFSPTLLILSLRTHPQYSVVGSRMPPCLNWQPAWGSKEHEHFSSINPTGESWRRKIGLPDGILRGKSWALSCAPLACTEYSVWMVSMNFASNRTS